MAWAWLFAGLSAASLVLFLYPYLIYPLILRGLSKHPTYPAPARLSVSLLFCAHNELECLPEKIANLHDLKEASPGLQILVYDDASTDGSHELLADASDLLTTVRGLRRTGKAAGMKQLVQRATGDILLFTDADVRLSQDAIARLLPYYGDPEVGGVCCTIKMLSDGASLTSEIGTLYWDRDDKIQQLESATGNVMGASGALFSVRRELYPDLPDTAQDDFAASMNVIFRGKRLVKATDVIAYTNGICKQRDEVRRKMRIGAGAYHTHRLLSARIRRMNGRDLFKYISRKIIRWFGGAFAILSLLFATLAVAHASSIQAAEGFLLAVGIAFAVAIRSRWGYVGKAGEIVAAILATFAGVLQAMLGRTATTWSPAKSRAAYPRATGT